MILDTDFSKDFSKDFNNFQIAKTEKKLSVNVSKGDSGSIVGEFLLSFIRHTMVWVGGTFH